MIIIDSQFSSLEEAIAGSEIPAEIREILALITVKYLSFDEQLHQGQMVIHKELADEVSALFVRLLGVRFPIYSVIPVSVFGWSDEASMAANNTSAFNIRRIAGTDRFSMHSYGWAIDINPMQNPCFDYRVGTSEPTKASYEKAIPGTLSDGSPAVWLFRNLGWVWGGDWTSLKDYMHFEKRLDRARS